jgi:hypothetical protein
MLQYIVDYLFRYTRRSDTPIKLTSDLENQLDIYNKRMNYELELELELELKNRLSIITDVCYDDLTTVYPQHHRKLSRVYPIGFQ